MKLHKEGIINTTKPQIELTIPQIITAQVIAPQITKIVQPTNPTIKLNATTTKSSKATGGIQIAANSKTQAAKTPSNPATPTKYQKTEHIPVIKAIKTVHPISLSRTLIGHITQIPAVIKKGIEHKNGIKEPTKSIISIILVHSSIYEFWIHFLPIKSTNHKTMVLLLMLQLVRIYH